MLAQWAFFIATGEVPEIRTEPVALAFHLAAEAVAAAILVLSGAWLLRGHPSGPRLGLVANGMLIYTVVVSPGYFAQAGQWPLVGMFAVLLVVAVVSVTRLWHARWPASQAAPRPHK